MIGGVDVLLALFHESLFYCNGPLMPLRLKDAVAVLLNVFSSGLKKSRNPIWIKKITGICPRSCSTMYPLVITHGVKIWVLHIPVVSCSITGIVIFYLYAGKMCSTWLLLPFVASMFGSLNLTCNINICVLTKYCVTVFQGLLCIRKTFPHLPPLIMP